jgi:predicted PurR-regulated permease PerM
MKNISLQRVNAWLLLGVLTLVVLYYGRAFLIPFAFAILFSMLMLPISRKLEKWGLGRKTATLLCILIILFFVFGILGIISAQAVRFSEDLPRIQTRLQDLLDAGQLWIQKHFGVTQQEQIKFIKQQVARYSESANTFATSFLSGAFGIMGGFGLVILYFFFLMWKREKYETFFLRLASYERQVEVKRELHEITKVASQYLAGRLVSMVFLGAVYAAGFTFIGLKNALFLSFMAVIPTIIPYVGAYIGGLFPLVMALVTGSTGTIVPVLVLLVAAQTFDNNVVEPLAEGESLNISPIVTIISLVLGNLIWGVAGMILFVPLFAVLRIVCDHIPTLNAFGFLLANDVEDAGWLIKLKKWLKKPKP